ncbi:MAG TPA: endolytic transglycosylase MltG, partial [Aquabacterium sp.]|nr:endolytic transglycosylase MltG [Aquabacterium sp.]
MSSKLYVSLARTLAVIVLLTLALACAAAWWWVHHPLKRQSDVVELSIEAGQTPREVAREWVDAGVQTSPWLLYQWFRWSGQSKMIRAGSYELRQGSTPQDLLRMLVRGDESLATVKLIEGWTFKRFRQEL